MQVEDRKLSRQQAYAQRRRPERERRERQAQPYQRPHASREWRVS